MTASDVRFTVNAIKSYGSKGAYYEKASKIYSVNVTGELTLTIYFRNNTDAALDNLIFPILPSGQYYSSGSLIRDTDDFEPVGTGQYKYSSYDYLEKLELVPNESYFGIKASLDACVVILPEKELASNMMEIDAVTCYIDDNLSRYSLVSDKNFKMYDMISNDAEFMVFNTKEGPFKDKKMRQAKMCIRDSDMAVLSEDSVCHLGNLPRPIRVLDQWTYLSLIHIWELKIRRKLTRQPAQVSGLDCSII